MKNHQDKISHKNRFQLKFFRYFYNLFIFLLSSGLIRIFSTSDFGVFALAMVFGNICSSIINFGLHAAYESYYFRIKNQDEKENLFNSLFYFNIILFLFFLIPLNFFQNDISYVIFNSTEYSEFLIASYLASNLSFLNSYFLFKTRNQKDGKTNSLIKISIVSIQFIISIILIFYLEFKIEGLIYAILISNLIILCYLFIFMINNKKSFDLRILKKALIFSYPLLPKLLVGVANSSYDKFIIKLLVSFNGLGVYDVSQRIAYQCNNFFGVLQSTFLPDFYKMANESNVLKRKIYHYS